MKLRLLILLLFLMEVSVFAHAGDGPHRIGHRLYFTPACPIVTQSFQNSADGVKSDPSATGWYLDTTKVPNAVYFAAKSHRLKAQTLGGEGVWYSQVFSIAGYTNIQVDAKVSSEGSFTSSEYVKVYYKLDNGPETLISAQFGSFGTPTVTSGMLTGSTVQLVIRIYNFSVGNNDYYVENYDVFKETGPCTVSGITVTASPTNSGVLTCAHPSTTITAGTTASGTTTYSWSGPNGYATTGSSITVSTAGTYTVTGTNSAGTGSASVAVTANNSAPDVTATGGALGCASSTTISASSSVSGATYSWTGPNGFTSSSSSPSVTAAGTYTVTVTNPSTGCTATSSVTVTAGAAASTFWLEDFTLANGTTSDAGATAWTATTTATGTYTYSVQNNEFKTSFTGQNVGTWVSGSISLAGKSNTVMSVNLRSETASSGDAFETADYVRVYLRINNRADSLIYEDLAGIGTSTTGTSAMTLTSGAFNGDSVRVKIVTSNSDPTERYFFDNVALTGTPTSGTVVANGGTITCTNTSVTLTGTYSGTGATYSWTGPGGFTSAVQNPTVSVAGVYTLTVTAGGCTATDTALVAQNTTTPANLSIGSNTGATLLTCASPSIVLTASSSTGSVNFSWSGPGGFSGSSASVSVSNPGTYIVTATNSTNGCASTASASVTQNITPPANLLMTSNPTTAVLTCTASSIGFTGTSSVTGANYSWTGPNGLTATGANLTVTAPGTYTLTATDPANGCTSNSSAVVTQDTSHPAAAITSSIPANALLSCTNHSVALSGNSSTTGVTYTWTGPSGYTATGANITVATAGNYTVTVTRTSNGCSTSTSAPTVIQNTTVPGGVSASVSDKISCSTTSVTLTGSSTTTGVTYAWTGPNGFTATTPVTTTGAGGIYTLTATDPVNGCSFSNSITVQADTAHPAGVTVTSDGSLNCTIPTIDLTGSSSTTGVTYSWAGPNGFFDPERVTSVSDSGTYFLTVANPANGCRTIASITVTADFTECSLVAPKAITRDAATLSTPTGNTGGTSDLTYKIYPNPVNTTAFVELNSRQRAHVSVEVYNGVGVREQVLFEGVVEAGASYKWTLAASRLTTGIHYCIIRRDNKVYTSKLLITAGRP